MRFGAALVCLGFGASSLVCRYTIRDIGFVNLRPEEYVLTRVESAVAGDGAVLSQETSTLGAVLCQDSNLRVTGLNARRTGGGEWLDLLRDADRSSGWFLTGPDLPPLIFPEFTSDGSGGADAELRAAVDWALESPLREEWNKDALTTFAGLWVFEGVDSQANAAALAEAEAAVDALKRLAPSLPRPLQHPARIRIVSVAEQAATRVSLWSMGLSDPERRPAVAVLYGRAKRAGDVLVGDSISETELVTQLALVGSSCECDTDRQWLSEPSLPLRWSTEMQHSAADSLGFDPESPLVVAEVGRILSQVQAVNRGGGSKGGVAALLLGYTESSLAEGVALPTPAEGELEDAAGAPSSLHPVVGDDWSFEEPSDEPLPVPRSWATNFRTSVVAALALFLALVMGLCIWIYTRMRAA
jgi:hypothetical protein